jgi:gluconokinase
MRDAGAPGPMRVVVMGPCGCGKSTIAQALAQALGWRFVEGDDLHPPANVDKMRAGRPLDDTERGPWLEAVAKALAREPERGVVVACSALKRRYRDDLRAAAGPVTFVLPQAPRDLLTQRLATRSGHYMPASLLDSQLADLEPLAADEHGISMDGSVTLESQLEVICARLHPVLQPGPNHS